MLSRLKESLYPRVNVRVTGPFLLVIILVAVAGTAIVSRLVAGNIQERLANQLADGAQAAVNTIVDIEQQQLAILRAMAFTEGVESALAEERTGDLARLLLPIIANNAVDDFLAVDTNGEGIYRLVRDSGEYFEASPLDTDTWQLVQRVITGGRDDLGDKFVEVRREDGQTTFYFAAPVVDDNDVPVGGLLVGISGRRFVRLLAEQSISNIALYDMQGDVLATSFRDETINDLRLPAGDVQTVLTNMDETSPISGEIEIEGVPYQFLYAPFEVRSEQVGVLGTALAVDFVTDRISTGRNFFFVLFAVSVFAVAITGLAVSRSIVNPVVHMVNVTRSIRAGDLNSRIASKQPDELGELGRSVDHMTGRLLEQNREIRALYDAQIQETAQRDAVLASISDAVLVLDTSGRVIMANETAHTLVRQFRADEAPPMIYRAIFTAPQQFSTPQTTMIYDKHYSILSTQVQIDSGAALGYVVVLRDITALVEAETLKDDIILQLSHELRTPLAASRGYIELVKMMGAQNPQMTDFIDKSMYQMDTLSGMIDQVIEVNVILAERLEIDRKPVNLSLLLRDLMQNHLNMIHARELKLMAGLPQQMVWIQGDGDKLTQAFTQVLKNAYNYTLPGGWIEVGLDIEEDNVVIVVGDSGVGIDNDEVDKVFDKLYRGRSADAGPTDTRGMGLGLYVSKQIIEAHRGTIEIHSRVNVGTLVTIRLPKRYT